MSSLPAEKRNALLPEMSSIDVLVVGKDTQAKPATPRSARLDSKPPSREALAALAANQSVATSALERIGLNTDALAASNNWVVNGSRSVTGTITALSARAMVGEVMVRGEPGRMVRVDLPRNIELFGFNGGTIRVDSIRSDLPAAPRLDSNGRLSFRFGGVIRVAGDTDGQFRGDVRIDVDYF